METSVETGVENMRFTGHESFPCRYAWLPKAFRLLDHDPLGLASDDIAMREMGIGKNMANALRFWIEVSGVAIRTSKQREYKITPFGRQVLDIDGYDPFLEDIRTLWLIHWNIATQANAPIFAWHHLFYHWPHPEFTKAEAASSFFDAAKKAGRNLTRATVEQHLDVFLRSYVRGGDRGIPGSEDALDSLLLDLNLVEIVGERRSTGKRRAEPLYSLPRGRKPELSAGVFAFAIDRFWTTRRRNEETLTLHDISMAPESPGQAFRLTEENLRERLETIGETSQGAFEYSPSAATPTLRRGDAAHVDLLRNVYESEAGDG